MAVKNNKNINSEGDYTILFYISILIILVSVFYIGFKLTGNVTDTAVVNVTIGSTAAINFTTDFVDFGTGSVNVGSNNATIDTDGNVVHGAGWSTVATNLTLENIGNTNVNLSIRMNKTAAEFIGGSNPLYEFKFSNNEPGSCTNSTITNDWIATSTSDIYICSNFTSIDDNDTINFGVKLTIPSSASGAKTDTFTATATALG